MKTKKLSFIIILMAVISLVIPFQTLAQPTIDVPQVGGIDTSPPWETFTVTHSNKIIFELETDPTVSDEAKFNMTFPPGGFSQPPGGTFTFTKGSSTCSENGTFINCPDSDISLPVNGVINGDITILETGGATSPLTFKIKGEGDSGTWVATAMVVVLPTTKNAEFKSVRAIPNVIVNAPAQVPSGGVGVTLDASASDAVFKPPTLSPTPSITSVTWAQTSGPAVTLTTSGSIDEIAQFDAPTVISDTDLEFQLIVSDGELEASKTITVTVRPPANPVDSVLLLDTSGSMGWHRTGSANDLAGGCCSRLSTAKVAAKYFVDRLGTFADNSRIGVAIFPGEPSPSTVLGKRWTPATGLATYSDFNNIKNDIRGESITCGDCTTIPSPDSVGTPTGIPVNWNGTPTRAGLDAAKDMLVPTPPPLESKSRIIVLLSDGAWNVGQNPANAGYLGGFVTEGIHIYTIGIGSGTDNVNHTSLQDISINTGVGTSGNPIGFTTYNVGDPATEPNLIPFFEKIMADMVSLNFVTDPPGKIEHGETKTHTVLVSNHDSIVSFTVSWESSQTDLLDFHVLTPNGRRLNTQISGNGFKNITADRELLEDPGNIGEWRLVVTYPTRATTSQAKEIAYNYSVITKSTLNMRVLLNKDKYFTGDTMILEARLVDNNRRLKGTTVEAKIRRPETGIGNWHFLNQISENQLQEAPTEISGEPLTLVDQKNYVLLQMLKKKLPKIISEPTIILNDKGNDGDRYPNDGIYAGKFKGFSVPGIYKFQVLATGEATNSQKFSREIEIHKFVDIIPDSANTDKEGAIEKKNKDGSGIIRISVIPFDQAKNYLGPGYVNEISITSSIGESIGSVEDMLYGAYQKRFKLDNVSNDPRIVINVRDVTVYDGPFSNLRKPLYKWEVSAHLGYAIPHGSLNNNFDGGISGMVDLGYRFTKSWSAELLLGYHEFDNKGAGDDFYWINTSLNGKYSYPIGTYRVFGNGGIGWYFPETGDDALGFNIGAGILRSINERLAVELGYNYHKVTKGDFDEFSTINLGIRYGF